MSGIYIPNFGKTKETRLIFVHADGSVLEYDRNTEYEAIFVPNHGRLGDLHEALRIIENLRDKNAENRDMAFALNWAAESIKKLPTIIPADPAEEVNE